MLNDETYLCGNSVVHVVDDCMFIFYFWTHIYVFLRLEKSLIEINTHFHLRLQKDLILLDVNFLD